MGGWITVLMRGGACRIPVDEGHFEFALQHYQELAATSGLSLAEYAAVVSQDRGFLDDHECVLVVYW